MEESALSYDLMVFDPTTAPLARKDFLEWLRDQVNEEPFDPTRREFSNPGIRAWLEEMLAVFPAMNGIYAKEDADVDDPRLTDYGINRSSIYACFAWSQADAAYETCLALAEKHRIGVFDVSNPDAATWRPDSDGVLRQNADT
jgi:hypothetical protein